MSIKTQTEYWLRGPVAGIPRLLQPVAHALLQARDEVAAAMYEFPEKCLWQKPGGVAAVAFHLQHMVGVLDRLFTYAAGSQLNGGQMDYLAAEGIEIDGLTSTELLDRFNKKIDWAIEKLKHIPENTIFEIRGVGRKQIPSTVFGLLFHAAEHTQRHNGQLLVTVKMLSRQ